MDDIATAVEKPPAAETPRHHSIMGARYVLVELGIVTAGLFIALTLNGVVEWAHHKQLVRDARRNIQQEIAENRHKVRENMAYLRSSLAGVDANIATLQQMRTGHVGHASLNNAITYDPLDDAAWQTARNTDALSYMPYDEAQRYSGLYSTISYVNSRALAVADRQFDAMVPAEMGYDVSRLPPEELTTMLRGNAEAKVGVETLMQILGEVDAELARQSEPQKGR